MSHLSVETRSSLTPTAYSATIAQVAEETNHFKKGKLSMKKKA
jgi:hypothetical protein